MLNRGMMCFLIIIQVVSGNRENFQRNSFLLQLVNHNQPKSQLSAGAGAKEEVKCKYKCMTAGDSDTEFLGRSLARFTGGNTNGTTSSGEMEAPAAKFSIFGLLSEDEEDKDNENENEYDENVKNEEDDVGIDFFVPEEINSDKPEGIKGENFLKQYHRPGLRMHNLVFPLLLAYKLKFFTVIPLLLGALVLLVGTTGIAGFFFALFSAALGIHVKSHDQ